MGSLFTPRQGSDLHLHIFGTLLVAIAALVALSFTPNRLRRPLIVGVTFLAGLFYALEFFWPTHAVPDKGDENFLTPYTKPFSDMTTVLQAFALGLGVYSLGSLHFRSVIRQRPGWGNSLALLIAAFAMAFAHIGKEAKGADSLFGTMDKFLYEGMLKSLDATMFSIIAFYIVSAAYRAFRIRSAEATILLVSAAVIMLGNVAVGQALTAWVPNEGFAANFRITNLQSWVLTKVNSPAILAIDFGLGIGVLATALRLWLSLERGSYFEEEL
ncbi:MAG: hypothetical protein ACKO5K_15210 [Armatimonadota bacterium]